MKQNGLDKPGNLSYWRCIQKQYVDWI